MMITQRLRLRANDYTLAIHNVNTQWYIYPLP